MALVPFPGAASPEPEQSDVTPYDVNSPPRVTPPAPPNRDPDEDESGEGRMTFLEHLDELRKRIIYAVISLVGGILVVLFFIQDLFDFIMRPLQQLLPDGGKLIFTEPTEAFALYIKIAVIGGVMIASPAIMTQVWLFVAPGLYAPATAPPTSAWWPLIAEKPISRSPAKIGRTIFTSAA